jgi:hypothetical protein
MNFVELDFLLGGERLPVMPAGISLPKGDYYAVVIPGPESRSRSLYPVSMRNRLPVIRVPLGSEQEHVLLDLQAAFDETYDGGRYHMLTRYSEPPPPELTGADREWAMELAAGMRR